MDKEYGTETCLARYRVLDLTDEKGFLCGKILADLGADVIKIEKPGGDQSRNTGPFYRDTPDPEKSLYWFAYNANKRGITLDIESSSGQEIFKRLVKQADVVIESFAPGYMNGLGLGYSTLSAINPRLIMTSITNFGQQGPYSSYKASDVVLMAMSGFMYLCGDADRPPVRISFPQAYLFGGAEAAVGTLAALYQAQISGQGQHVDISTREAITWERMQAPIFWEINKQTLRRSGQYRAGMTTTGGSQLVIWPCKDGYITFNLYGGTTGMRTNRALTEWMNNEGIALDLLKGKDWASFDMLQVTEEELQEISEAMGKFFLTHTKSEFYEAMQQRRIMIAPVSGIDDLVNDPQLVARGFWVDLKHPELGTTITYPGAFAKLSETPYKLSRRAPLIGEHNDEVYRMLEGEESTPTVTGKPADEKITSRPLEGIKVADFSWVTTGPLITKYLADLGAEVVHIESSLRPDVCRTSAPYKNNIADVNHAGFFPYYNNNKYGVTLNLQHPRGVEIARRIVAWADIMVEAFRPGTMSKFGLDYDEVKKIKRDIIMLSVSSQGQTGPGANVIGMGLHVASLCGFMNLTGWPDRPPCVPVGAYPDYISPRFGLAALIAALDYRRRTGKGQHIDISQYESSLQFLAPALLDFLVNGRAINRNGNYCANAAPHGAYPCLGEDRWCAISVFTDEEWHNCCQAMGNPPWTNDPRFSTLAKRKENEAELDALVGEWTENHDAEEVMEVMQSHGVAAGVVENCDDTYHDPQLRYRNYLTELNHREIGKHSYQCPSFRLSGTSLNPTKPAPCLGEHNYFFYTQVLGMSDEEFVELQRAGVFD